MKIEVKYCSSDPHQCELLRRLMDFCRERGIRARIEASQADVEQPVVVIDGFRVPCRRKSVERKGPGTYKLTDHLTRVIERQAWSL